MRYTFSDEVLAAVAQCVQLGILTSTDVVDHLRMLEVEPDPADVMPQLGQETAQLTLTPGCKERHARNIADLLERGRLMSQATQLPAGEA